MMASLGALRAAMLIGLMGLAHLGLVGAQVAETCALEGGCEDALGSGARMLQRQVQELQREGIAAEEEEESLEEAQERLQLTDSSAGSQKEGGKARFWGVRRRFYWPRRRRVTPVPTPAPTPAPPPVDFCGHDTDAINRVIAPPKEVQRLITIMLGVTWGIGFPNMTETCKSLPINPNAHYITFTLGTGILQGMDAEQKKLDVKRDGGEAVTTQDKFAAATGAFKTKAFCIALRMCSYDPAKASQTWMKQFTFGFYHKEGLLLFKKGPLELKFHGLAFSSGGELYIEKLASPLWGYGEESLTAPVTNLHWWIQLSCKVMLDTKKAIEATLTGTLGAYVEADGEKDIATFLSNMFSEEDGTIEKLKEAIPKRYHVKMLGTVNAKLSFDLKKLFGPSGAKSDTSEGQVDAPAKLFKITIDASLLREASIDFNSADNTYLAQYFSAKATLDLTELLKVSDFFQELLSEWVGSLKVSLYFAYYIKARLNFEIDAGFRIGGEISMNCGFLNKIPTEVANVFPLVKELIEFCKNKLTVNLDLVATRNKLDFAKTCLHINTHKFCLDHLPTCPHPVSLGGKCSLNTDCTGDEYGVLKRGYCKSQNGITTTFCTGKCEKLAGSGGSCSAHSTGTINLATSAENEKCEAHFLGASPACLCGTCTNSNAKLADGSWCATNANCASDFCDKGSIFDTALSQGCSGKCVSKLNNGAGCHYDDHCKSGHCSNGCRSLFNCNLNGKCVACLDHNHCGSGQYCENYACYNKINDGHGSNKHWKCKSNKDICGTCSFGGRMTRGYRCSVDGDCGWGTGCGSWWQNCWGCRCHCD